MLDYKYDFPPASSVRRYPLSGIDVLVIGGGIGGMFAAINCFQKGHNPRVLEASSGFDLNGGFIRVAGSVTDHLGHLAGLAEGFELLNQDPIFQMFSCKGDVILPPMKPPSGGGTPFAGVNVHRSSLLRLLYEYARHLGIDVQFGVKVSTYYEDAQRKKGGVKTKSGQEFEGDIVVAADGIGSQSACLVENKGLDDQAKSSGYAIFRATYPAELAYREPNLFERFSKKTLPGKGHLQFWLAPRGYAVIFTTKEVVNFHIIRPDKAGTAEEWDHQVGKEVIMTYLDQDEWGPDVRDLITACPDNAIFDWKLMFRNPKPNWVSTHGCIVQLGDAAHTFLPSSGNGATQAMEDGISLASCLQLAGKAQIPLGVMVHNKLRFQRTSCAQKIGFRNRKRWIGADLGALKANPTRIGQVFGAWVALHDAEQYAYDNYGNCVNHLTMGAPFENTNIPPGHEYKPWTMDDFLNGSADTGNETGDWQ